MRYNSERVAVISEVSDLAERNRKDVVRMFAMLGKYSSGGFSSGGDGQPHAKGPVSPTEGKALRPDRYDAYARDYDRLLQRAKGVLREIEDIRRKVLDPPPINDDAPECKNCHRWVALSRVDRLRSGECNECYVYARRTGEPRPKELWAR